MSETGFKSAIKRHILPRASTNILSSICSPLFINSHPDSRGTKPVTMYFFFLIYLLEK